MVEELDTVEDLSVCFVSLRDNKPLILEMIDASGEFTIRTDSMDLAGDIIQSLAAEYLQMTDLQSEAEFPYEIENLKKLITKVDEIQAVKQQLGADIAENSGAVRALVVRAEDARLLAEWLVYDEIVKGNQLTMRIQNYRKKMKQFYIDLHNLNRELVQEHKIRNQSHNDLVDALKQINIIIQKAANLRSK